MEHIPTKFETIELSFGETMRCDERYPSLSQLARKLDLDLPKVKIEQACGAYGFYEIFPFATTDQADEAAAGAQELWDRSAVSEMFNAGKVKRARFGFGETETGFRTWLGSFEEAERPWEKEGSREDLADLAHRDTLIHALDINGFRRHARVSPAALSDQELLVLPHKWRVSSKYIPEKAREESQIWLAQHNQKLR